MRNNTTGGLKDGDTAYFSASLSIFLCVIIRLMPTNEMGFFPLPYVSMYVRGRQQHPNERAIVCVQNPQKMTAPVAAVSFTRMGRHELNYLPSERRRREKNGVASIPACGTNRFAGRFFIHLIILIIQKHSSEYLIQKRIIIEIRKKADRFRHSLPLQTSQNSLVCDTVTGVAIFTHTRTFEMLNTCCIRTTTMAF